MEVNKDEALRCLEIGRRHLNSGNYTSARKFGGKSIALFPTPEAKQFLAKVDQEEASASPSTGSSSSFSGSTNPSSTPSSTKSSPNPGSSEFGSSSRPNSVPPRPRSTPVDHKPAEREYTPEQVAAVKAIRSSGGDFYKVLGIGKDATESEIKKAYRKVNKGSSSRHGFIILRVEPGNDYGQGYTGPILALIGGQIIKSLYHLDMFFFAESRQQL